MTEDSPRSLPPLNWVRAFEAAARGGSFAVAARELGVTAAAVGQQVRLLEAHLGAPLFRRTARGLVPTDLGTAYRPSVVDALDRLRAGTAEVFGAARRGRTTAGKLAGPLMVRAPGSFGLLWLLPRLQRFRARHPEIALGITTRSEPAEFAFDGIDVELRYGPGHWAGLQAQRLGPEYAFPVVAKAMAQKHPGWRALRALPLLHVIGYRDGWPAWIRHAGKEIPETGHDLRFDVSMLALEAARQGLGAALGRWPMIADDLRTGTLVAPVKVALPIADAYHVVWSDRSPRQDRIQAFRDFVLEEARRERPPAWAVRKP
ncbi:MAG: LysR family transcriptional regulator [Rhodospirillales bacterium]|nr:LysR family transcriptional regulator [Rhodospirillales bacterium]